jgi:pimeloyl-ACP methyl ester carboxylesterase
VCGPVAAFGQNQSLRRPLELLQTQYRLRAGERLQLPATAETLAFMLSASTRSVRATGVSDRSFPVAPNVTGDQVLLGVPLTTTPGDYSVAISFVNAAGEERRAVLQVTVEPFATAASGAPPVVLLDGWQLSLTSSCPMSSDSTDTFGNLQSYLGGSPNFVPTVYFFENCTECPNCPLEQLGADLGTFLNSINYSDGTPVPLADVVAHSMGGLIVRSYLSGKEQTSGTFSPPANQKIRKAVFIATPHFGSFQADSTIADILFAAGNQTNEMKRGSQFLWDLATWNQFGDDLRGVDAVAVIGNGGPADGLSQAGDGVVVLSSGSLDFVSTGRTRIVDYCHVPPGADLGLVGDYLNCTAPGIAYIESPSHQTYQIVSSFLLSSNAWETVGNAPAQDENLSKYGGMVVADVNTSNQFVGGLSDVLWDSMNLSEGAASGELFYKDFVDGSGSFAFGASMCGPFTETAGVYSAVRCKFGPSVHSVGPLIPGPGRVVQAGTTITISGTGFGAQQCDACQVTASNPESTTLQVSSWSNTVITALLPAAFGVGFAKIGVTTASGAEAINIMAGTVAPAISLSKSSLSFAFTVGGATPPAQSVTVTNSGGGALTWSASSNATWLNVSTASGTLTVSVNPAGLTPGPYDGIVSVTAADASNSPQAISVTLTVTATTVPPSIALSDKQASFTCALGCKAPPAQTISISNSGGGTLTWSATSSADWILVSTASGSVSISVNPAGLSVGRHTGSVSVTAAGASNSPQSITVVLAVLPGWRHILHDPGN